VIADRSPLVGAIVLLVTLAGARSAAAQSDCRSATTQSAMTQCAAQDANAAQGRLDSLLILLKSTVDSARYRELSANQLDWAKARDGYCRWDAASYSGGSVEPMWYANCLADQANARIDALRLHLCLDDAGMAGTCPAAERFSLRRTTRRRH
jgi:uncharacterized protein YecT (DUF1311 family)